MKQILFILFIGAAVAGSVKAQQPTQKISPGIEERWKKINEVLQKEVQLTAQQSKAIAALFKSFFAAADKLRKENPNPNPKIKEGIQKLVHNRDEKVKKILTMPQYANYKKTMEKLKPPPPGPAPKK
jgi:uncharacterized coiled-coil DUF342 family protein